MPQLGPLVLPLFTGIATFALLYNVRSILLPFVLAMGMAFLLNPLVRSLEVRGIRRGPIVVLLFLSLMSLLTMGLYKGGIVAAREADEAAERMPVYVERGRQFIRDWQASAERAKIPARRKTIVEKSFILRGLVLDEHVIDAVGRHGHEWPGKILSRMPSFASGILPALELVIIVPFVGFLVMWEGSRFRNALLVLVPSRYVEMTLNVLVELDNSLGRYLRGVCVEAVCIGCLAYAGFSLIGLDYALQIALVAGFANLIPYMGPIISGVLAAGVALFQNEDPVLFLKVAVVVLSLRLIDDIVIQPTVLRQAIHLHPILIVFAVMAGAHLYGFWGLLFAVPVACAVKVLLEVLWSWYRSQYGFAPPPLLPEINRIPLI